MDDGGDTSVNTESGGKDGTENTKTFEINDVEPDYDQRLQIQTILLSSIDPESVKKFLKF